MLHTKSVTPRLLDLLKFLMSQETFSHYMLVGGTSLALQTGHRVSVDIDLFGKQELDELSFSTVLKGFGNTTIVHKTPNIIIYQIDGIKLDIVNYPYPWIREFQTVDNIRLASKEDIAAMKLAAITGRGSKKHFIDLFYLLKQYSLNEMLNFYEQKYPDGSRFMVLKSLTYFDDAEQEVTPKIFDPLDWSQIKTSILASLYKTQSR